MGVTKNLSSGNHVVIFTANYVTVCTSARLNFTNRYWNVFSFHISYTVSITHIFFLYILFVMVKLAN